MLSGNQIPGDAEMPHFHIWRKDDQIADSYWVFAASPSEARRFVALNALAAADAENEAKFLCETSTEKTPPPDVIYRRLNGPLTIVNR